jgi:hypothetical protein
MASDGDGSGNIVSQFIGDDFGRFVADRQQAGRAFGIFRRRSGQRPTDERLIRHGIKDEALQAGVFRDWKAAQNLVVHPIEFEYLRGRASASRRQRPDFIGRRAEGDAVNAPVENRLHSRRSDRLPRRDNTGIGNGADRFVIGLRKRGNGKNECQNKAEGFQLPKYVVVKPFGDRPGWGENSPICDRRLIRDEWKIIQQGKTKTHKRGALTWLTMDPPEILAKPHPQDGKPYEIREKLLGIKERNGPWYVIEHSVINTESGEEFLLGRTDWADWCHSGDLLYAKEGRIWRLRFDRKSLKPLEQAEMLIDLRDRAFIPRALTEGAKRWGGDFQLPDY